MSNAISINCEKRDLVGSGNARRMRREGTIPAVVYAHGAEAVSIAIADDELKKLAGHNGMAELKCSCGCSKMAIIKEVQRHPITNKILHVDFLEVKMDEKITVQVALVLTGDAIGLSQGGQLEQVLHEIEVECLPANVPEVITVDVSALALDQAMRVADLALPAGVVAKTEAEEVIAHVRMPHTAAEPEAEAAAEPAADADKAEKKA